MTDDQLAWNNFVMRSYPYDRSVTKQLHQAALATLFMGLANNGGLNAFLTSTYEFDATEFAEALTAVGAFTAAEQLHGVVRGLNIALPVMTQSERWDALDEAWNEEVEHLDTLSQAADDQLMEVLDRHVRAHQRYYLTFGDGSPFPPP